MKRAIPFLTVLLIAASCIRVNENPVPSVNVPFSSEENGVFIHVSKGADNPHKVLMALSMANKFMKDHDVLMYFDIDGIEIMTNDAPNLEMEPFGSSDELIEKLVDANVTIFACPGCMKAAGVSASDLRSGVRVAEKDEFFDFTDGRILSIDY